MDIEILLSLQQFRNGAGGFLTDFLNKMTFLGELNTAIVLMAIIYWCVSKDIGSYLLMGWSGNRLVNGVLKVTVCAYRPWIRDPRIVPYGNSMTTATGYSFPSGHTMNAATTFGGFTVRRDMPTALRVVTGLMVLLVGFSRPFLGVHTPQDVLVGAAAGMLVMWLVWRMMQWLEAHPEKNRLVVLIVRGLPGRLDSGAALCRLFHGYFGAGKADAGCGRRAQLLRGQPDCRPRGQRLDPRPGRDHVLLLPADVLCFLPLPLVHEVSVPGEMSRGWSRQNSKNSIPGC